MVTSPVPSLKPTRDPTGSMTETRADLPTDRHGRSMLDYTWELEMLISGALLFGLLQLPGRLDAWWEGVRGIVAGELRLAHFLGYYYVSLITYTLIATFAIHIVARAYWGGLLGLRSVYPEGPDFGAIKNRGPLALELLRSRVPSLDRASRAADRLASLIFAFAFLILAVLVFSVLGMSVFGGLVWIVRTTVFPDANPMLLGLMLLLVTLAPMVIAGMIDHARGDALDPRSRLGRVVRAALTASYYMSLGPLVSPISTTLVTRARPRSVAPLMMVVALAIVGGFLAKIVINEADGPFLHGYRLYPEGDTTLEVDPRLYMSMREAGRVYWHQPAIQSDIVTDPYVRLFLPYYPHGDRALLQELCPEGESGAEIEEPTARADAHRASLDCLARMHAVHLDGSLLAEPGYRFHVLPDTAIRGIVTYLPAERLTPGAHELRIVRHRTQEERDADEPAREWIIPFWR